MNDCAACGIDPDGGDGKASTTTLVYLGVKWRACDAHAAMWAAKPIKDLFPALTAKVEAKPADMAAADATPVDAIAEAKP